MSIVARFLAALGGIFGLFCSVFMAYHTADSDLNLVGKGLLLWFLGSLVLCLVATSPRIYAGREELSPGSQSLLGRARISAVIAFALFVVAMGFGWLGVD